ncbi:hypothetical protein [Flavobacterium sp.]|uniref:hypothetical protein n=1 Tax=Flavobacterium sp. TaxID=239 RepID=UPI003750326C
MENPNIKTKIVHSQSKTAWNIVGENLGGKYKIARIPYFISGNEIIDTIEKSEALRHAQFIVRCFNNSDKIISVI